MARYKTGILLLVFLTLGFSIPVLAVDKINVYIDKTAISMNIDPVSVNDRTLIPVRSIFEALGAIVEWDGQDNKVTATKDGIKIELTIGSSVAYKNGQPVAIDVPAQTINDRTFVPLRFITEALGYHVYWNGKANGIFISTQGDDPELALEEQLSQVKTWSKTYGGNGFYWHPICIKQTKDGGYIVAGNMGDTAYTAKKGIYLIKLDISGNKQWEKLYDGAFLKGENECIKQTNDGGFIIVGSVLIKTDEKGLVQWINDEISGDSVIETKEGTFVLGGIKSENHVNGHVFIAKVDVNGFLLWEKVFDNQPTNYVAVPIKQTSDGGYIIVGNKFLEGTGGSKNSCYVINLDQGGNVKWEKTFEDIRAFSIEPLTDGGYALATGTYSTGVERENILIIKLNSQGEIGWQKMWGGVGEDEATAIIETGNGDLVVTGGTEFGVPNTAARKACLIKLDSKGNTIFEKLIRSNSNEWGTTICQCFDGGYVVGLYTCLKPTGSAESGDVCIIKTDSNGNFEN